MDFVTFGFGLGALLMLAGYIVRDYGRRLLFGDGQGLDGLPASPARLEIDRRTMHAFAAGLSIAGFIAATTTMVALVAGLSDFHGAIVVGVIVVLAIIGAGYWGYDVLRRHAVDAAVVDQRDLAERRRAAREAAAKPAPRPEAKPVAPVPAPAPVPTSARDVADVSGAMAATASPFRRPTAEDGGAALPAAAPPADDAPVAAPSRPAGPPESPAAPAAAVASAPARAEAPVPAETTSAPGAQAGSAFGDTVPAPPPAQPSPLAARFGGVPTGWQPADPAPVPPPPVPARPAHAGGSPFAVPPAKAAPAAPEPDPAGAAKPAWASWSAASVSARTPLPSPPATPAAASSAPADPVRPTPAAQPEVVPGSVMEAPAVAPSPIEPAPVRAEPRAEPAPHPVAEPAAGGATASGRRRFLGAAEVEQSATGAPAELAVTAPLPSVPAAPAPAVPVAPPAGAPPGYQPPVAPAAVAPPSVPPVAAAGPVVAQPAPASVEPEPPTGEGTPVELLPLRVAPKRRFGKPSVSMRSSAGRSGDAPAKRPGEGEPEPSLLGYEHVFEQDQDADLPAWPGERPAAAARPASPEPPADGRSLTDPAAYAQRGASPTWLFDDLEDELAAMPAPKEEPIDPFRFVRPVKKISVLDKLLAEGPATNGEPGTSGT